MASIDSSTIRRDHIPLILLNNFQIRISHFLCFELMSIKKPVHFLILLSMAFLSADCANVDAKGFGIQDSRTFSQFRQDQNLTDAQMRRQFGAAARVVCRWGARTQVASAAIISQKNIFVTANHVFINKNSTIYRPETHCYLQVLNSKIKYSIQQDSITYGYDFGADPALSVKDDWAVGKLDQAAEIDEPFKLPPRNKYIHNGKLVIFITQGYKSWGNKEPSVGRCNIRAVTGDGVMLTDCDVDQGGSGGPILDVGGPPYRKDPMLAGIMVGVSLVRPKYRNLTGLSGVSVGVSVRGDLLTAIERLLPPKPRPKPTG